MCLSATVAYIAYSQSSIYITVAAAATLPLSSELKNNLKKCSEFILKKYRNLAFRPSIPFFVF